MSEPQPQELQPIPENKRVAEIDLKITSLQAQRAEIRRDLIEREDKPEYRVAKSIFDTGIRVKGWDQENPDPDQEINFYIKLDEGLHQKLTPFTLKNATTEQLQNLADIHGVGLEDYKKVFKYLSDLTQEE
jgi:hypothetical protein